MQGEVFGEHPTVIFSLFLHLGGQCFSAKRGRLKTFSLLIINMQVTKYSCSLSYLRRTRPMLELCRVVVELLVQAIVQHDAQSEYILP